MIQGDHLTLPATLLSTRDLAWRIRRHVVEMTHRGNSSHIGSGLSIADVLAVLYGTILRLRPQEPQWSLRDRFILSKGHAGAAVYAVLAECGFIPLDMLASHFQDGSLLSGHISHLGIPGVEMSTGSLGHGLSVACGRSFALKKSSSASRVFVLMSDGECDEGSNWEAILFAGHHHLDNLVAIIDYNKLQSIRSIQETLNLEPFADKWRAFNWAVAEVDGHDHQQLTARLSQLPMEPGKPTCILAHTVKGKGISFMENNPAWHYRSPLGEDYHAAVHELEKARLP